MKERVSKIFIASILIISSICVGVFGRVPLGAIKGIEQNLKSEYLRITPLVGVAPWHTGWIRNIAEYDETGMGQLVRALFHEVQGQFTVTQNDSYPAKHFSPSLVAKIIIEIEEYIKKKYPPNISVDLKKGLLRSRLHSLIIDDENIKLAESEAQKKYDLMQKIINNFSDLKKKSDRFLKASKDRFNKVINSVKSELLEKSIVAPELKKITLQLVAERLEDYLVGRYSKELLKLLKEKVNKSDQALNSGDKKSKRKARKKLKQNRDAENLFQVLQKEYKSIIGNSAIYGSLQDNIEKQKKERTKNNPKKLKGEHLDDLLDGIVNSIDVCGYFDNAPNLFKYGLHVVFMSFLYEKFDSKKDFQDYFKEFDDIYFIDGGKATILKEKWVGDSYKKSDIAKFKKDFKKEYLDGREVLTAISFEQYVYARITERFFALSFPNTIQYKNIEFKIGNETFKIPDCLESAAKNTAYCALRSKDKWPNLNNAFKTYLKTHNNEAKMGTMKSHVDWAKVVENVPWLAYYRVSVAPGLKVDRYDKLGNGFIKIPNLSIEIAKLLQSGAIKKDDIGSVIIEKQKFIRLQVGQRVYFLFDANSKVVGYELIPSLRNFIMIFNYLFGLKLPKELSIKEILLRLDFNSSYAPKMLDKLGFKDLELPRKKSLDDDDFMIGKGIKISVMGDSSILNIRLRHGHGQADTRPISNKQRKPFDRSLELRVRLENKKDPRELDFKSVQCLILNNDAYKENMNSYLYNIKGGQTRIKRWFYFFPLISAQDKIDAAKILIKESFWKPLNANKRDTVTRFIFELIKNMEFVDGATQIDTVRELSSSEEWSAIVSGKNYSVLREQSFKNPSFLFNFLIYVHFYADKWPVDEVKKAIKIGLKSKYEAIYKKTETILRIALRRKSGFIDIAKDQITSGLWREVSAIEKKRAIDRILFLIKYDLIEGPKIKQEKEEKKMPKIKQEKKEQKVSYEYFNRWIPRLVSLFDSGDEQIKGSIFELFSTSMDKNLILQEYAEKIIEVMIKSRLSIYVDKGFKSLALLIEAKKKINKKKYFNAVQVSGIVDEVIKIIESNNELYVMHRNLELLDSLIKLKFLNSSQIINVVEALINSQPTMGENRVVEILKLFIDANNKTDEGFINYALNEGFDSGFIGVDLMKALLERGLVDVTIFWKKDKYYYLSNIIVDLIQDNKFSLDNLIKLNSIKFRGKLTIDLLRFFKLNTDEDKYKALGLFIRSSEDSRSALFNLYWLMEQEVVNENNKGIFLPAYLGWLKDRKIWIKGGRLELTLRFLRPLKILIKKGLIDKTDEIVNEIVDIVWKKLFMKKRSLLFRGDKDLRTSVVELLSLFLSHKLITKDDKQKVKRIIKIVNYSDFWSISHRDNYDLSLLLSAISKSEFMTSEEVKKLIKEKLKNFDSYEAGWVLNELVNNNIISFKECFKYIKDEILFLRAFIERGTAIKEVIDSISSFLEKRKDDIRIERLRKLAEKQGLLPSSSSKKK